MECVQCRWQANADHELGLVWAKGEGKTRQRSETSAIAPRLDEIGKISLEKLALRRRTPAMTGRSVPMESGHPPGADTSYSRSTRE
jgi:hypothetical protein